MLMVLYNTIEMHLKRNLQPGGGIWEPLELRELKKELANINCVCSFCETYRKPSNQLSEQPVQQAVQQAVEELYKDEEMQSECATEISKPPVFVVNDQTITEDSYLTTANLSFISKDHACPTCEFTLNLLRGGATKTLKDEECEAKPEISSLEKSTGKIIKYLDKTTSYCKPVLKYPLPNTLSAVSSVESIGSPTRSLREVTFAFNDKFYGYEDMNSSSDKTSQEKSTEEDNDEEEEETSATSTGTESEQEVMRPTHTSLGLCTYCADINRADINRYIDAIRPSDGGPNFHKDNGV